MAELTDAVKDQCISKHLPYEIWMLRWTMHMLQWPWPQPIFNAFIESFCIHARNLSEFFSMAKKDQIRAELFVANYEINRDFPKHELIVKISEQITHLQRNRTDDPNAKISDADRKKLFELLEAEVKRFEERLTDAYLAKYVVLSKPTN